MALIFIVQLVSVLCGIISVCFIWWQRWDSSLSSPVQRDSEVTREDRSLTYYSVRLPEFSEANIPATEWLYKVEATTKANQWSESTLLRMLPASLTGQFLTAYHKLSEEERLSSSSVLNSVAATFSPTCEEALEKFFSLTMTDKDVGAYLKELEILLDASSLKDLPSVSRQSVLPLRFIDGLPQDVQTVLHVQSSSVPLQEIVSIACRYLPLSFTEEPQRPSSVQYYGRNTFRTRRETSASASNVTPTRLFSRIPFPGNCFSCGKSGHRARECPKPDLGNENGLLEVDNGLLEVASGQPQEQRPMRARQGLSR